MEEEIELQELESDPLDISSMLKEEITSEAPECVLTSSAIIIKEELILEETQGLQLEDEVFLLSYFLNGLCY